MDESIDFNLDNNDFATYLSHTGMFLMKDYSFTDQCWGVTTSNLVTVIIL